MISGPPTGEATPLLKASGDDVGGDVCPKGQPRAELWICFALFGTLVALQYSVVVTAANDLVGNSLPTGIVLFVYTIPSVLIRILVPFITFPAFPPWPWGGASADTSRSGGINYPVRVGICVCSSVIGLQSLAWARGPFPRMLGILMASVSSNLGDMSFLQLCSRYPPAAFAGHAFGGGASAIIGAWGYAFATSSSSSLAVSPTAAISFVGVVPPLVLTCVYVFFLPPCPPEPPTGRGLIAVPAATTHLSLSRKVQIVTPVFWRTMVPFAALLFIDNADILGFLPNFTFPLPFTSKDTFLPGLMNRLVRGEREFYPLYITAYQASMLAGRMFSFSGANNNAAWWLTIMQICILAAFIAEARASGTFGPLGVLGLTAGMGLSTGAAYMSTYQTVRKGPLPKDVEETTIVREWLMSTVSGPGVVAIWAGSAAGMGMQMGIGRWRGWGW